MAAILIAEDEQRIAAFVEKGLKSQGFTTQVAPTGPEALDLALTDEFDLLVLDIRLPGMDGFEVLSHLRGSGSTMPVIMSGSDMRATPPLARMSAGTRSRAMTATAPASSAILG